ncbi:stage 0 sporulation family protein [Mycoplasmatota bacterium zrk1]
MSEHIVVPIQFKKVGKRYYFATNDLDLKINDFVVVETARGLELGIISDEAKKIDETEVISELKPVLRIASDHDLKRYEDNKAAAKDNYVICKRLIAEHGLDMKLLSAEYTLDRKKSVFYYTSEDRVDFRELVKDLASKIKTRIELRQVGERDGAKALGGIGFCGRELCCSTHLCEFDTISIKMAKNQRLSLNPTKITGVCGKLLCCIKYENKAYSDLQEGMPKIGSHVDTPNCKGCKVIDTDILNRAVKVSEESKIVSYDLDEINDRSSK